MNTAHDATTQMKQKKSTRLSALGSQLTTIISVALVLLILGITAMAGILARSGARQIQSNTGFIVRVNREVTDSALNVLKQQLPAAAYAASVTYSSPEQIMQEESQYLGEDAVEMLDINPYNPEFDVKVKPAYATADSIEAIKARLNTNPAIEEVITAPSTITNVNFFITRISWILIGIAAALLAISFVLINNTVYLAVYSRRFIIHTMKLVGAKAGFIRRPFVIAGAVSGLVAGLTASALTASADIWLSNIDPVFATALPWSTMAVLMTAIIIAGIIICAAASAIATNRYLRSNYDDMFMK